MLQEYSFDTGQVELHYVKSPDEGPPLVLLHGLTSAWQRFIPMIPYLLLRHTVYAVTFRGHGKSGRVAGRYRCMDFGEDIRLFIKDRIREPAIVLGNSLGGLVAAYLAAQHPELVSALILDDPVIWDNHIEWAYDYFTREHELTSMGKTAAELREILGGANSAWEAHCLSQLDPGPLEAVFDGSLMEGFEPETMLKDISCPVLYIRGNPEKGSVLTKEQAEFIVSAIPDCVSEYWDDAGHATHANDLMRYVGAVTYFLESLER